MKAVKPIGSHIMWKSTTASDTGDHHRFFRFILHILTDALYRGEYGVASTTRAPAGYAFTIILHAIIMVKGGDRT
nr:hypothetical protein [uncultured Allomuricauda sp.]